MTKTVAECCKLLRATAAWVREEFPGCGPEERAELEAEAANIDWAAAELERLAIEPKENRADQKLLDHLFEVHHCNCDLTKL